MNSFPKDIELIIVKYVYDEVLHQYMRVMTKTKWDLSLPIMRCRECKLWYRSGDIINMCNSCNMAWYLHTHYSGKQTAMLYTSKYY